MAIWGSAAQRRVVVLIAVVGAGAGMLSACEPGSEAEPVATTPLEASSPSLPAQTAQPIPATQPAETPDDPVDSVVAADGALSTRGSEIVDADGRPVSIRGVNWFGFETQVGAPHGLWVRNLENVIDQIAELGFNTIRLPFSSAMLESGYAPDGINEAENPELAGLTSLEVMDRVIAAASAAGLDVVLDRHALGPDDRHHLWYNEAFPPDRLVTDWQLLAERYREADNVIGADLYNEPHDEACWGCGDPAVDWKAAAERAGDAIHEIEPEWLIFVEGVEHPDGASCDGPDADDLCTWWGGALSRAGTDPVQLAIPNKVVYSPHEYATSVFRQPWFDDPAFPDNLRDIWDRQWGYLEREGLAPVVVGEFGTTLEADVDAIWLGELLAYLDEIGAGFLFWTLNPNSGDTGGILEDDWVTVDDRKMGYLVPYLER